jgi:uncharacterized protein YjbJ (UPF0337 family)
MLRAEPGTTGSYDDLLDPSEGGPTVGLDDKVQHQAQDAKGKAKEAAGAVTGNDRMKAEGKDDQGQAKAKEAGRHAKEAASDVKDTFKS